MVYKDPDIQKFKLFIYFLLWLGLVALIWREKSLENRASKAIVLARSPNLFTRNLGVIPLWKVEDILARIMSFDSIFTSREAAGHGLA